MFLKWNFIYKKTNLYVKNSLSAHKYSLVILIHKYICNTLITNDGIHLKSLEKYDFLNYMLIVHTDNHQISIFTC